MIFASSTSTGNNKPFMIYFENESVEDGGGGIKSNQDLCYFSKQTFCI